MTENNDRQIVVMKGWEGFADRLQCLSHLLHYCIVNNADICIDWRDDMWGQEKYDFHDYFEIVGVNTITINKVLERIKNGASVIPSTWSLTDIINPPNPTILFNSYTYIIDSSYKKIDKDIIITNCKGNRIWHIDNLITNIRLKKDISDIIITRINKLQLPFTAIHLRGTDRLNNKPTTESIKPAVEKFNKLHDYAKKNIYVFSDMKEMITLWKEQCPQTNTLFDDYSIYKIPNAALSTEKKGTHQYNKSFLDYFSITKHDINLDSLTDFIILCYANFIIGNNSESCFTQMCIFISSCGKKGISKWLHGYEPNNC